ncbi:MAG: hypothetical protein M3R17_14835 [Bacteroidota bacterium]|nr:hypothetical protein [Bacteroidota bacterium]
MKAFRAKTRNKAPCHGVVGGVVEIPPDTAVARKERIRHTLTRRVVKLKTVSTMVATHTNTCYDNTNVTTAGLFRVFIVCLTFVVCLIMFN